LEAADTGLPALVSRIQEDGPAVVRRIGDAVTPEGTDEIGQVASAFNEVHATAVRVAGEQALLRQNLDTIVVNLSRRTQSLVDRQLGEIEDLESRERDPDQLGTLFRIDHLATRVRRHAESLLVLAGVEEMRRQGVAAPVLDVVRTAVGEVEQYPRIKFGVMPTDLVVPSAVDDVAHLLAELLDNATEFSAPSTAVTVTSQPLLGGGLRLQVTDQGLGIPADQLAMLNERLRQPGDIDVAASRTLGIYVVARLAARHGITVRLIPAEATSGTIAQVDLPSHLIVSPLDTTDGVLQAIQPTTPRTESLLDRPRPGAWRTAGTPSEPPAPATPPAQPVGPAASSRPGGVAEPGQALPSRQVVVPRPSTSPGPAAPPGQTGQPPARPGTPGPVPPGRTPSPSGLPTRPVEPAGARSRSLRAPEPELPPGDSPIFDAVQSAWFKRGGSSDWSSPADEGWRRAAAVLRTVENTAAQPSTTQPTSGQPARPGPARHATPEQPHRTGPAPWNAGSAPRGPAPGQPPTGQPGGAHAAPWQSQPVSASGSGLPVRQRGATLVPGSIPGAEQAAGQGSERRADASNVASTLSNLQRGVSRGREESGGWVPKRPGDSERSNS
jgi:signal transduction histidine kinase